MQDDVDLCALFPKLLEAAVSASPDRPFAMYSEWGSKTAQVVRIAALTGAGWAVSSDPWLPAPAVIFPAGLARECADYLDDQVDTGELRDAFHLLGFLRLHKLPALISVPNLVQHDVPFKPSLLPNGKVRGPRRTAWLADAAIRGWSSDVCDRPEEMPYHSPQDLSAGVLSEWDGDYGWTTRAAFSWLADRGYDHRRLRELLDDAMEEVGFDLARAPIGYDAVRECWLAAFNLGWTIADSGRDLINTRECPTRRSVFASMAAAPFRRVLSSRLLDEWGSLATPLLGVALRQGTAAAAFSGSRNADRPDAYLQAAK